MSSSDEGPASCHCRCGTKHPAVPDVCDGNVVTMWRIGSLEGVRDVLLCDSCAVARGFAARTYREEPVSDVGEPGLVLRHIDLPLEPGARIIVRHSPGWAEFDPLGPELYAGPQGYTIDCNGERWRAVFVSSSIGPEGAFLEVEIEGRYREDEVPDRA